MGAKQYYYFRFRDDFFEDPKFIQLLGKRGNGAEYIIVLQKLATKAIRNKGFYLLPQNDNGKLDGFTLASILRVEPELLLEAMDWLEKNEYINIAKNEDKLCLMVPLVINNSGSSSDYADKKRAERAEAKGKKVLVENTRNEKEGKKVYGRFSNVYLTEDEYVEFMETFENAEEIIEEASSYKAQQQINMGNDFARILRFAKKSGIKKITKEDRHKATYERCKREAEVGYLPSEEG